MSAFLQTLRSPRLLVLLLLGFSSGLPLALSGTLLQAWLSDLKVDITVIGLFGLVGLPYTTKFIWAPVMDRFVPPFLGRRRGWILIAQLALILFVCVLGMSQPEAFPGFTALVALLVAFSSASQDIAIDAYKVEVLEPKEFGLGAATNIMGYRIGMLASGAGALAMADHIPYRWVYFIMAGAMLVGVVTNILAPEPGMPTPVKSLKDAVVLPWKDFFGRKGSLEVFSFVLLYKLDVVIATALMTPFIMGLGFTKTDIALATKTTGMIAVILGGLAGGALMVKLGMKRSLWFFGIIQGISTLTFFALAHVGHVYPVMIGAIAAENFFSGMGTAAYAAFLMSLCNPRFTATQYALLSSIMAITRVFAGAFTGFLAKAVGWEWYYIIATLAAVPSLLLLLRYPRWSHHVRS